MDYRLIDILAKIDGLTPVEEHQPNAASMKALANCIAATLRADSCAIRFPDELGQSGDATTALEGVEAPIAARGKRYGSIVARGIRSDAAARATEALQIIGWGLARELEFTGMNCVLRSRFAQLSMAKRPAVRRLLAAAAQHPDKTARLLARSFYLELAGAGFTCNQIINAATEIISQLSSHLQRQKSAACERERSADSSTPVDPLLAPVSA